MLRRATWFVVVGGLVMLSAHADARPATVSDFAICNQEAAGAVGGNALPAPGGPVMQTPPTPGAPERAESAASGAMARGTDSTGKLVAGARDPRDEGMAADRAGDASYQSAYRDCMSRRGITAKPAS